MVRVRGANAFDAAVAGRAACVVVTTSDGPSNEYVVVDVVRSLPLSCVVEITSDSLTQRTSTTWLPATCPVGSTGLVVPNVYVTDWTPRGPSDSRVRVVSVCLRTNVSTTENGGVGAGSIFPVPGLTATAPGSEGPGVVDWAGAGNAALVLSTSVVQRPLKSGTDTDWTCAETAPPASAQQRARMASDRDTVTPGIIDPGDHIASARWKTGPALTEWHVCLNSFGRFYRRRDSAIKHCWNSFGGNPNVSLNSRLNWLSC